MIKKWRCRPGLNSFNLVNSVRKTVTTVFILCDAVKRQTGFNATAVAKHYCPELTSSRLITTYKVFGLNPSKACMGLQK